VFLFAGPVRVEGIALALKVLGCGFVDSRSGKLNSNQIKFPFETAVFLLFYPLDDKT
jgi:hypothetical protein